MIRYAVGLLMLLATGGCSLVVPDTKPLPAVRLEPPGSEHISEGGYRFASLLDRDMTMDSLVLVAMSGGGKRSASFSYGVLEGMREMPVQTSTGPRSLLDMVDGIAGVSGGSFTAAYYGLHHEAAFGHYEDDFLYKDTNNNIYGVYLLPWNWTWLIDPAVGTNDLMARVYDEDMFHGATYADLEKHLRPLVIVDATDINYGEPFLFTQETFDLICSDLDAFPLARAVAASNGFPGLFSPITLTSHAPDCGGRRPGWLQRVTPAQRHDALSRIGNQANAVERYLDINRTRYVHLVDGGVSDNLALRAGGIAMETIAESPGSFADNRINAIRRVLVISVDGQSSQDSAVAQRRLLGGVFSLFGLVSGAQIDRYNFETLTTVNSQLQGLVAAIKRNRCAQAKTIDGVACDDVSGALVHVALSALPDTPETEKLRAIPTGLTIERDQVDALVAAGRQAVINSAPLRDFLAHYPPAPGQATAGPVRNGS